MSYVKERALRARSLSGFVRTGLVATALVVAPLATVLTTTTTANAAGTTYYVDDAKGNDNANGTSPDSAWRSLSRVPAGSLNAGDTVLLKRGHAYPGSLNVSGSGTGANPITIKAYGSGTKPVVTKGDCLTVSGNNVVVSDLRTSNCNWAGITVSGNNVTIKGNRTSNNVTGIFIRPSATNTNVTNNAVVNNRRMSVNTPGGDDDSGAFGILVQGDSAEIQHNRINGHHAKSYDYGMDGAAVELYGAQGTSIHHNRAKNNLAFTELGNKRTRNTTYSYNAVTSKLADAQFLVTRGAGSSSWGPILNTKAVHNTVKLTGNGSQGFVCYDGCNSDILTLHENIISAKLKVGYADGAFNSARNIFWGGQVQFKQGGSDRVTNPDFASKNLHDVRVTRSSPVVDASSSTSWSTDVAGQSLPVDGNNDGVHDADIGAYELH